MEECRNEDAVELNQAEGSERKKSSKKKEKNQIKKMKGQTRIVQT